MYVVQSTVHVCIAVVLLQMLHMYLEDDGITVDNDTALRLGCLEMRRFFRDMSQGALKSRQNFAIIE